MIYLDTGCLVKLYYPEPQSARVAALIDGRPICFTPFHQLEMSNALSLKVFLKTATMAQVTAVRKLVAQDIATRVLIPSTVDWIRAFDEAAEFSEQHTPQIGCRSLDMLHCAAAKVLGASEFISTDVRQQALAQVIGLKLTVP